MAYDKYDQIVETAKVASKIAEPDFREVAFKTVLYHLLELDKIPAYVVKNDSPTQHVHYHNQQPYQMGQASAYNTPMIPVGAQG